jgi:O-antigen ligase
VSGIGSSARVEQLVKRPISPASDLVPAVTAATLLSAALVGAALVAEARLGIALLLGLIYLPIAITNLQLALVLWFPLVFLEGSSAFNLAAKAGGLLVVGVWVFSLSALRDHAAEVLRRTATIWLSVCALLLWYSLSVLWADDRGMVYADLWHWYAVALLMLIVATTVSSEEVVRLVLAAFVVGAVLTVAEGIVSGSLTTSATAIETATEGRLDGGQGDPNFLAAGLVPAIVLALSLRASVGGFYVRWLLLGATLMLSLGLVASESRGGIVAAVVALIAAMVVFKRRRAWVFASFTIVVGVAIAWFSISPTAWDRVTDFDNGGSGRSDLWTVAWRMTEANSVNGVGLNNYPAVADEYVREPGAVERADLIVDNPHVVHNAYLQLLAETGVIGLALFLAIALGSLAASWRAAALFERAGDLAMDTIARGVIVATLGLLAASFFISNGVDKRLWLLFGLGPALLAVAARRHSLSDAPGGGRSAPLARPSA